MHIQMEIRLQSQNLTLTNTREKVGVGFSQLSPKYLNGRPISFKMCVLFKIKAPS